MITDSRHKKQVDNFKDNICEVPEGNITTSYLGSIVDSSKRTIPAILDKFRQRRRTTPNPKHLAKTGTLTKMSFPSPDSVKATEIINDESSENVTQETILRLTSQSPNKVKEGLSLMKEILKLISIPENKKT